MNAKRIEKDHANVTMNDIYKLKRDYIFRELWISTWNASVQHASLYQTGAWKDRRDEIDIFKKGLIMYVQGEIIPKYKEKVNEKDHLENMLSTIEYANGLDNGILGPHKYKLGIAQKLLNLALKYYWCLDEIAEPPHCPVDRIIINKTRLKGKVNWTDITKEGEYLKVIDAIRDIAAPQGLSLS